MSYLKEATGLSQDQAIENLTAVVRSNYFRAYEFHSDKSRVRSDMITVDSIGGWREGTTGEYQVEDLADMVVAVLEGVKDEGIMGEAFLRIALSEKKVRAMKFERRLYDHDLILGLTFSITRERRSDSGRYTFCVSDGGFKKSYFESEGLDFDDAKKKRDAWNREVNTELKQILPHPIQAVR
ncbi:MAG: hypothetical protein Q7R76_02230 [Candidatus Woesearchaeota archaeon]|nr:hypothetical protein [Candidatus Woesearchaeota archaeon]